MNNQKYINTWTVLKITKLKTFKLSCWVSKTIINICTWRRHVIRTWKRISGNHRFSPSYNLYHRSVLSPNHYNLEMISKYQTRRLNETGFEGTKLNPQNNLHGKESANFTCYCPVFPKSRSTAAWTFPDVAIRALMFSCVSKNPISWSWESWVAYNCSGGSGRTLRSGQFKNYI
jgi:hypothetical protein